MRYRTEIRETFCRVCGWRLNESSLPAPPSSLSDAGVLRYPVRTSLRHSRASGSQGRRPDTRPGPPPPRGDDNRYHGGMTEDTDTITLRRPDDWHVHLRDGPMLRGGPARSPPGNSPGRS